MNTSKRLAPSSFKYKLLTLSAASLLFASPAFASTQAQTDVPPAGTQHRIPAEPNEFSAQSNQAEASAESSEQQRLSASGQNVEAENQAIAPNAEASLNEGAAEPHHSQPSYTATGETSITTEDGRYSVNEGMSGQQRAVEPHASQARADASEQALTADDQTLPAADQTLPAADSESMSGAMHMQSDEQRDLQAMDDDQPAYGSAGEGASPTASVGPMGSVESEPVEAEAQASDTLAAENAGTYQSDSDLTVTSDMESQSELNTSGEGIAGTGAGSMGAEPALGAESVEAAADKADPSTMPPQSVQEEYQYEQATTATPPQPVSIDSLIDTPVVGASGERLGEVAEVVVNSETGQVGLVLSVEDSDKRVLAPVEEVSVSGGELVWETAANKDAVEAVKEYDAQNFHKVSDIQNTAEEDRQDSLSAI